MQVSEMKKISTLRYCKNQIFGTVFALANMAVYLAQDLLHLPLWQAPAKICHYGSRMICWRILPTPSIIPCLIQPTRFIHFALSIIITGNIISFIFFRDDFTMFTTTRTNLMIGIALHTTTFRNVKNHNLFHFHSLFLFHCYTVYIGKSTFENEWNLIDLGHSSCEP